ncbi:MAG: 2-oxoacid:ferredoxin oxidoreductase subunit beta [Nanoarchaeota archaeon]|nr:2-oxoacid:ferredoxin oxidoreductase subunit beta [Nanoarchaeota archaeon]
MEIKNFDTKKTNTWCPGCFNFAILNSMKETLTNLVNQKKIKKENIVSVCGVSCAGKIFDYINVNGFLSLHGRVIASAIGINIGNPNLKIIGFSGDGETYSEGLNHLAQAARKNIDMTMIVHDNQAFALTTGQQTPTTEIGYRGKSNPSGTFDKPLNPISFALICGATFVARTTATNPKHMNKVFEEAIKHKGFAFVEVLQPCITFHNNMDYFRKNIYEIKLNDFDGAMKLALEWDYNLNGAKIPIGIFYKESRKTFVEQLPNKGPFYNIKRSTKINNLINEFK